MPTKLPKNESESGCYLYMYDFISFVRYNYIF